MTVQDGTRRSSGKVVSEETESLVCLWILDNIQTSLPRLMFFLGNYMRVSLPNGERIAYPHMWHEPGPNRRGRMLLVSQPG